MTTKTNLSQNSLINDKTNSSGPLILCIVDGPNWIFNRHVMAFQKYLGNEFQFSITYRGQDYEENDYDLIYPLEFDMVSPEQISQTWKYITGIRSFVSWVDWDFLSLVKYLASNFKMVHVVSRQLHELFSPYLPDCWYVTHGVDTDYFSPDTTPSAEPGRLRLGWAGNRKTHIKGFRDYIEPLGSLPGIELVYCGFADRNLGYEEMPGFYKSIDAYICASSFEGNNNSLLEAAAMEKAIITTPVGTVPEYLENNRSALIVERSRIHFEKAVTDLRDDPTLRRRIGKQARKSLLDSGWDWPTKAEEYRRFFEFALKRSRMMQIKRLTKEPLNDEHYASILKIQFVLEKEIRLGYVYEVVDLQDQITELKRQIDEIKHSETYALVERFKSLKIIRVIIWLYNMFKK